MLSPWPTHAVMQERQRCGQRCQGKFERVSVWQRRKYMLGRRRLARCSGYGKESTKYDSRSGKERTQGQFRSGKFKGKISIPRAKDNTSAAGRRFQPTLTNDGFERAQQDQWRFCCERFSRPGCSCCGFRPEQILFFRLICSVTYHISICCCYVCLLVYY